MVEFCQSCKTSLPKADVTIRNGEIFASHDFTCPFCNELANPPTSPEAAPPAPGPSNDVLIRAGKTESAPPREEPKEGPGG